MVLIIHARVTPTRGSLCVELLSTVSVCANVTGEQALIKYVYRLTGTGLPNGTYSLQAKPP